MHSAASLNVHLNCFPLPQRRITLCFSTSYVFRALVVLSGVNEVNGHLMRNGSGRGKDLPGALRSSARLMTPPRSEQRGARRMCSNGRCKEGGFQKQIKLRTEKMETEEITKGEDEEEGERRVLHTQIGTFDTRLTQTSTERRRDMGREEGGDENDDEQQQTFYSFDSTLSSAQWHSQNITASSIFATPPFSSNITHTIRIRESDVESTGIGADEVAVGEVVIPNGKAVVGELTVVGMCTTANL